MKRILHLAKGTGVLPDGSTETFQERCNKGVSHTAYAKGMLSFFLWSFVCLFVFSYFQAEYWVENKYVRLYSILKPKFSDIHYYIFFPTVCMHSFSSINLFVCYVYFVMYLFSSLVERSRGWKYELESEMDLYKPR
jgi:hypothetical protein